MTDDKNREKNDDQQNDENREDSQKELEEIMGKLTEKPEQEKKESQKEEPAEEKKEQPEKEEISSEEPEDLEGILEKISEKKEQAPVEELTVSQRVIGIFTQPQAIFTYLRNKPEFVTPLIIIIVIGIISSFLVYDIAINSQIENIEKSENIPAERQEMLIDQIESRREGSWRYISIFIFPPIGTIVMFALISVIFLFIGNVVLGGKAGFKQIFSAYSYAYLIPAILGSIVKLPLILSKGSLEVYTGPAVFFPSDSSQSALFRTMESMDIFTIWFLVVFGIGFATIYRFSRTKGIVSVFVAWLLWVLLSKVVLGSFSNMFGA